MMMRLVGRVRFAVAAVCLASVARGQVLDDFEGEMKWKAIPSDGVVATVTSEKAGESHVMRIDYDFTKGMGFVVVRREMPVEVPADYRFGFRVRGEGLANNFEFKLVDAKADGTAGDNVWWVNKAAYEWPGEWRRVAYRNRHVTFAWGPGGGKEPLRKVAAVEFAIAASKGGKGTVWIDDLRVDAVAAVSDAGPVVRATSDTRPVGKAFGVAEICDGVDAVASPGARVELMFAESREIGALTVELERASEVDVATSTDGVAWDTIKSKVNAAQGLSWIRTPGTESKGVRVTFAGGAAENRAVVRVLGPSVGDDMNAMLRLMAKRSPRGMYPRYLHDEATSWTVIGTANGEHEALLSADGQVELSKGGFAIEPFVQVEEGGTTRLLSWAEATLIHEANVFVIPRVTLVWPGEKSGVQLTVCPVETGAAGFPSIQAGYYLTADSGRARIVLAVRPMQSLPPSQWLNVTGGFTPIRTIEVRPDPDAAAMVVNDAFALLPVETKGLGMIVGDGLAGEFAGAGVRVLSGGTDLDIRSAKATDVSGLAWGAIVSPWKAMKRDDGVSLTVIANLRPIEKGETLAQWRWSEPAIEDPFQAWRDVVNRVRLIVPPSAKAIEETWRSQQRMIMVNTDGPAYQPGSRTYERAWIRDGASIGTAMCFTGHVESMREFVDWYGAYQYESGKVPCVVDKRGPDPVPEHDSHGEFIHCVATVYRFTGDKAFVEKHWAGVVKAVGYLDSIIAERSTEAYKGDGVGSDERGFQVPKKAFFGLVPESISHEGYSAKPMHSHWDGFWTMRGFKDAAFLAGMLGKSEKAGFEARAAAYRANMASSVKIAGAVTGAAWVPGCVELGDFDATSTAVAVWPCEEWDRAAGIPTALFEATFEKYWAYFEARRDGNVEWKDYTPYEVRVIGAMLRLAERDAKWLGRAHALNEWFLADQRPAGWRQWGEVVFRDKNFAGFIGDYPHTWVGADYLNSVRAMFLDETAGDDGVERLVLGRGITREWLAEAGATGVGIGDAEKGAPTWFGEVSFVARAIEGGMEWEIRPKFRAGREGTPIVLRCPMGVKGAEAEGCTVVRAGGGDSGGVSGGVVELKGPYVGDVVRVRVR
jgi:hypothetical protein